MTEEGVLNLSTYIEEVMENGDFKVVVPFYKGYLYPFLLNEYIEMFVVIKDVGVVSSEVIGF